MEEAEAVESQSIKDLEAAQEPEAHPNELEELLPHSPSHMEYYQAYLPT